MISLMSVAERLCIQMQVIVKYLLLRGIKIFTESRTQKYYGVNTFTQLRPLSLAW